ncbi:MAG: NADPH-dependent 7-cyano-7-deazaguanine reductase QueF [Chloroflexi bacterium]|nr:NADPH-dependent 7-cyano-7-deazaguanine reductase QueF [Chloroflexota bacterium]
MADSVTQSTTRYGEAQIAAARLEAVPNPARQRDYRVDIACPEFTCLCPRSGYPDFAVIRIAYVPDESLIELRSLKLYINRFRDEYVFHEAAVNRILDDLVQCCDPKWIEVVGDFNPRGNVKTVITAAHRKPTYAGPPGHRLGNE